MKIMNKKIPAMEAAWIRGQENILDHKFTVLQEAIDRLKDGSISETVTISYSLPLPGSEFPALYTIDGQQKEIVHKVKALEETNTRMSMRDVHWAFITAFGNYKRILEYDVPGLTLRLQRFSNGYEKKKRHLGYLSFVPVGDSEYLAGDINIIFVDNPLKGRNANAYGEYQTRIGETTSGRNMIAFNSYKEFRRDGDPELYHYPVTKGHQHRYSFSHTTKHELGHLFGIGHFPFPKPKSIDDVMASEEFQGKSVEDGYRHIISSYEGQVRFMSHLPKTPMNAR